MIDHVIFVTIIFYMQMRFDHDLFLLILNRFDSSFLQMLISNQAYHDFDQSRLFFFDFTDSRDRRENQDARR